MTEYTPGIYRISNEEYHASPGLSRSTLWTFFDKSPLHSRVPKEGSEFGSHFHTAVENQGMSCFTILPDDCRPGSGAGMKARKEAFEATAAAEGLTVLNQKDYDDINGMVASVYANQECIGLMEGKGAHELSFYWEDPDTGLLLKCRTDYINMDTRIILDWKSCGDARPGLFYRLAWKNGWGFQGTWYPWGVSQTTGVPHNDFRFVAVEDKPPYGVQVHPVQQEVIDYYLSELPVILEKYAKCLESDVWPCYEEEPPGMGLPAWVKRKMEGY